MAWLDIIGILPIFFVSRPTMACLRDYKAQLKEGGPITFDPLKLGIRTPRAGKSAPPSGAVGGGWSARQPGEAGGRILGPHRFRQ